MEEEEDASDPREGDEATGVVGDGEEDGGAEADDILYFIVFVTYRSSSTPSD